MGKMMANRRKQQCIEVFREVANCDFKGWDSGCVLHPFVVNVA